MGQKSTIDRLPESLREKLIGMLHDPACTQQEITDAINDAAGDKVVTKSAVNRYAIKMREFTERNRQAREVAKAYLVQAGDDTQNHLGKVINEQVRMLVFDLMMSVNDIKETLPNDPAAVESLAFTVSKIAKSIKDLESAASTNMEREEKMRQRAKQAAEAVESTVRKAGLSDETVETIKAKILGITK